MRKVKLYAPTEIVAALILSNAYLLLVSNPSTRATYFGTLVLLILYLIDQIKKIPSDAVNDAVSEAQAWAKGRLTGIDVDSWGKANVQDDKKGDILVTGTVWRTYPHNLYSYRYHKKNGQLQTDSTVELLGGG